ncbi:MAG: beta-ureidopropionase, partial [Candidatus Cloacimonetes bacterium]|nr:beta-ureidopropionase [Candidatus Cloacimonadota bacterium]
GFAEKVDNNVYNSSMIVTPDGKIRVYRKTHLFDSEKLLFEPGNTGFFVEKDTSGISLGMMICFDWIFPESARTLALKGAQVICHPVNLVLPWCQEAMKTRCVENLVFAITANRTGTECVGGKTLTFTGQSQITSARGEILYRAGKDTEELHILEINPEDALEKHVTDRNHVLQDRREEFYYKNSKEIKIKN